MGLVIANIAQDVAPGASATTRYEDIKKSYTVQNLVLQSIARSTTTSSAGTLLGLTSRFDRIFINTISSSNVTDWEGEHLYDFDVLALKNFPMVEAAVADNIPMGTGINIPQSPYPFNYDKPYGMAPNRGTQIQFNWIADAATTGDAGQYSLTAVGNPDVTNPIGMLANVRDSFTAAAAGEIRNTRVIGKRLAGVYNFGTSAFSDLAAAAAYNVTTFRDHAITESDDVKLGPVEDFYTFAKGSYEVGALIDEGSEFIDLGFNVTGDPVGIDISVGDWKYRSTRGVTDAGISYPIRII